MTPSISARRAPLLHETPSGRAGLWGVVIASVVATQVKTWAEQVLQPAGERLLPPTAAEKARFGADPADHPENMPPDVLVDDVVRLAGPGPLAQGVRDKVPPSLHWVVGIGAGTAYGLLARRVPGVRAGRGTAFGAVLFAATHASLLPAIGVQAPLDELPRAWWVWEAGSHLVYGAAMDAVLTLADAAADAARR